MATITLPQRIAEKVRQEAEKQGLSIEEYVIEILSQGLDPSSRAASYIEAAETLLGQAREELGRGDVRQAAEKLWGAAALAIKAYASWREGRRLASHRELWEYSRKVARELGGWVYEAWNQASGVHVCFYEDWCTKEHVEAALRVIQRLIQETKG